MRLPPPKCSVTSNGSSSVTVQWKPIPDLPKGLIRGYIVIVNDTKTTVLLGPCFTNTTVISSGCIEVAAFTVTGLGNSTGCLSIEKETETGISVFLVAYNHKPFTSKSKAKNGKFAMKTYQETNRTTFK